MKIKKLINMLRDPLQLNLINSYTVVSFRELISNNFLKPINQNNQFNQNNLIIPFNQNIPIHQFNT